MEGDEAVVRGLFAGAGITPDEDELTLLAIMYPMLRQLADRIYELDLGDQP